MFGRSQDAYILLAKQTYEAVHIDICAHSFVANQKSYYAEPQNYPIIISCNDQNNNMAVCYVGVSKPFIAYWIIHLLDKMYNNIHSFELYW